MLTYAFITLGFSRSGFSVCVVYIFVANGECVCVVAVNVLSRPTGLTMAVQVCGRMAFWLRSVAYCGASNAVNCHVRTTVRQLSEFYPIHDDVYGLTDDQKQVIDMGAVLRW